MALLINMASMAHMEARVWGRIAMHGPSISTDRPTRNCGFTHPQTSHKIYLQVFRQMDADLQIIEL